MENFLVNDKGMLNQFLDEHSSMNLDLQSLENQSIQSLEEIKNAFKNLQMTQIASKVDQIVRVKLSQSLKFSKEESMKQVREMDDYEVIEEEEGAQQVPSFLENSQNKSQKYMWSQMEESEH